MSDIDFTNPLAVVVAFFGILFTFLLFFFKFTLAFGFFGIIVCLGIFTKMFWSNN